MEDQFEEELIAGRIGEAGEKIFDAGVGSLDPVLLELAAMVIDGLGPWREGRVVMDWIGVIGHDLFR